jgi:flagellar protein FlaG
MGSEVKSMLSEALNITGTTLQKVTRSPEQIDTNRKKISEEPEKSQKYPEKNAVQPEEILQKIKALTEDGMYSVRFEADDKTHQLVVKIVDSKTQKVIRQVPAEEMLGLREALTEYQGNFVDTKS